MTRYWQLLLAFMVAHAIAHAAGLASLHDVAVATVWNIGTIAAIHAWESA